VKLLSETGSEGADQTPRRKANRERDRAKQQMSFL